MQMKLDVTITDDAGQPFYTGTNTWDGLKQTDVVMMESLLIKLMADLNAAGKALAESKSGGKGHG
jgi:hypothetical protein